MTFCYAKDQPAVLENFSLSIKKGKKSPSQGLTKTIDALPQGWHTLAEDHLFSQGEWQLLSIARAIAADPAVLLLDEITASLDAETEERVLSAALPKDIPSSPSPIASTRSEDGYWK